MLAKTGDGAARATVVAGGGRVVDVVSGRVVDVAEDGGAVVVDAPDPRSAGDDARVDPQAAAAKIAASAAAAALVVTRRRPSVASTPMVDKPRKPAGRPAVAIAVAVLVVAWLGGCSSRRGTDAVRPAAVGDSTTASTKPRRAVPTTSSTTRRVTTTTTRAKVVAPSATTTTQPPVRSIASQPSPCPRGLAGELSYTGRARQLVTVSTAGYNTSVATIELWQRAGPCWAPVAGPWSGWIGENGFSDQKREGDGTTPTGIYVLGPVIYGNAPDPGVNGPYHHLVCGDWWDEDPSSAQYNTFQHVACGATPPFGGDSEALWTETGPYPSFAVVDYNTAPVVRGKGSAIFVHADMGHPTTGCVSIPVSDLDQFLRWLQPGETPAIVMGPASEITRF